MKKFVSLLCVSLLVVCGVAGVVFADDAKWDHTKYLELAKDTMAKIIGGDMDGAISQLDTLTDIGVAGAKEHISEADTPDNEKKIMQEVIDNHEQMGSMSVEDIEKEWHEGGHMKAKGVEISSFDHYSEVMCHYDAVIHPITAAICLKGYKKSSDKEMLEQAKAEIEEVIQHVEKLSKMGH
ncbi:MAG: hypothetical protein V1753_04545 [Pseudomonadota bacterium]